MNIVKYFRAGMRYLVNSDYRFLINSWMHKYDDMPDEEYVSRKYEAIMEKRLDLENPKTLNEKLQWLKLYYHNPMLTVYVDKYLVRDYIKTAIGEEYLIPLIGVWDSPDDINFDSLPNQFVLKCNHNSGTGMCICKDKTQLNIKKVKRELKKGITQNYYLIHREWPYKNVPRKIIAEAFMSDKNQSTLIDYKLQCFDGKFDSIFVCVGRGTDEGVKYHYFDREWNYLPYCPYDDLDETQLKKWKPRNFELMIELAEKLAVGLPEVRVDFYEINGRVYFGELTFFSQSGFDTDITEEADLIMGTKITLPEMIY